MIHEGFRREDDWVRSVLSRLYQARLAASIFALSRSVPCVMLSISFRFRSFSTADHYLFPRSQSLFRCFSSHIFFLFRLFSPISSLFPF